jgi:hypothetical protein
VRSAPVRACECSAATNGSAVSIQSSPWQVSGLLIPELIRGRSVFVVRAVACDDLPAANRAFFYIASWDVKLPLNHAAIMASLLIGSPISMLVTVTNPANISALDRVGRALLGCEYLFRPSLDHRNATIEDAFRMGHVANASMCVVRTTNLTYNAGRRAEAISKEGTECPRINTTAFHWNLVQKWQTLSVATVDIRARA